MPVPVPKEHKLFQPAQVGNLKLAHRIVLAPMARARADDDHLHHELPITYYSQRASTPGTLLITEATLVSPDAGGFPNVPGIWSDEQVDAWKKVTDAVHAKGCYINCQLWSLGRVAFQEVLDKSGTTVFAPSPVAMKGRSPPRELTTEEVEQFVRHYYNAAKNAIRAGFDGVELHAANGYLVDQFLQDMTNHRTDKYGGSIENRCRFALEIISALCDAVGEERVGFRISPYSPFFEMRMKDPIPTFSYLISAVAKAHPNFGYLHFIEAGTAGDASQEEKDEAETNDFARKLWQPRTFISAGGYSNDVPAALKVAEEQNALIAFGRAFLANPDLPERIRKGVAFNKYIRASFYTAGHTESKGYIDYPFATPEQLEEASSS